MKLPRYLKILLISTAAACIWGQLPDQSIQQTSTDMASVSDAPELSRRARGNEHLPTSRNVDLFPWQGEKISAPPPDKHPAEAGENAPNLPFRVIGSWWNGNQRALILTDGSNSWVICCCCRARNKVWAGAALNNAWILLDVTPGHLTFRWLPRHYDRRLALADMKFKPAL